MKEDFLTIPDAPDYEINSQLICRNKKTGQVLTVLVSQSHGKHYSLYFPNRNKRLKRAPKTLRAQAVAAAHTGKFVPIISYGGGKYEISERGKVRNAVTKHILKKSDDGTVLLHYDETHIRRSVASLLWESHGVIPKPRYRHVEVVISRENVALRFGSCTECAHYLAPKISYSVSAVANFLYKRRDEICGWKVSYEEAS